MTMQWVGAGDSLHAAGDITWADHRGQELPHDSVQGPLEGEQLHEPAAGFAVRAQSHYCAVLSMGWACMCCGPKHI